MQFGRRQQQLLQEGQLDQMISLDMLEKLLQPHGFMTLEIQILAQLADGVHRVRSDLMRHVVRPFTEQVRQFNRMP